MRADARNRRHSKPSWNSHCTRTMDQRSKLSQGTKSATYQHEILKKHITDNKQHITNNKQLRSGNRKRTARSKHPNRHRFLSRDNYGFTRHKEESRRYL